LSIIDTLPQYPRGFKYYNPPGPQDEILFSLGVAAAAGILAADAEFAKAADKHVFFPGKGIFDNIQNTFNGTARFLLIKPELEIDIIDNLFFGQGHGLLLLPLIRGGMNMQNIYLTIIIYLKITVKNFFEFMTDIYRPKGLKRF
jgi:hypothetical protein